MTTQAETCKTAAEPFGRTIAYLAGTFASRVRLVVLAFKNRRDAAVLASFDDRMLADIGLTRSDLREAFSEPLWRDPSPILVNRVMGHRRWRTAPPLSGRVPSIQPSVRSAQG